MKKSKKPAPPAVNHYVIDVDTSEPFAVITYTPHKGRPARGQLGRSDLRFPSKIKKFLDDRAVDYTEADVEAINRAHDIKIVDTQFVTRMPGWRESGVYAWPGLVFMEDGKQVEFLADDERARYAARGGSLEGWHKNVCPLLGRSSYAILALGWVFAGPLLRFSSAPEGAILNLCGFSSTAKSGACTAALAAMGMPLREETPSWNLTVAGLEDFLEKTRDTTIVIDDLSRDQGKEAERAALYRRIAHTLAGGGHRKRSKSFESQFGPTVTRSPALCLTSGEHSYVQIAARAGKALEGGVRVRFIDVPVPPPDAGGVFDRTGRELKGDQLIAANAKLAVNLELAIKADYGHAYEAYVRHLNARAADLPRFIEKRLRFITKEMRIDELGAEDKRIATKLGLAYAGLRLAIEAKAVDLTPKVCREAVLTCFDAVIRREKQDREHMKRRRQELRDLLRDNERTPVLARGAALPERLCSFRRSKKGDEFAYITADAIAEALELSEAELDELLEDLKLKGDLAPGAGSATRPVKVGGKSRRFLVFPRRFYELK